jgi:serine/threonine protein kinase
MSSSNDLHRLSPDEWNELQRRSDNFAIALSKGMADDWTTFLDNLDGRMRLAVLGELVKIDLDHRWSRGEKRLLDEYLTRFPELGPMHVVPVDLICEEFRLRRKHNENPNRDEYKERFPAQHEEVIRQIENELSKTNKSEKTDGSVRGQTEVSSSSAIHAEAESAARSASEISTGFHKHEMIGEGHFAEVWRAKSPGGIEIAIKVVRQPIDRDAAQRELSALDLLKDLRHPCLLATFQYWVQDRKLHIAMELADGTLRNRLKQCKKQNLPGIPRDELLMYFADAAEGLDFLHSRNVFHRDIKPDNIMLLQGHAKVADFGLARLQERQMATVSFAGTPVYMAPEAWGGKGGPRSDQYSLAFAYAELRQGKRPVEGDDFTTVMSRVLESEPDLSGIPPEEVKVLRRAMSKRPEDRFINCSEFMAAMARATGTPVRTRTKYESDIGRGSDASDDRTYKEPSSENIHLDGRKKKKFLLAVGSLLVLAGISFAVWHFGIKDRGETKPPPPVVNGEPPIPNGKPPVERVGLAALMEPVVRCIIEALEIAMRPYLPPGYEKAFDARTIEIGKRKYYDKIVRKFEGGQALFILLQPTDKKERPFYIMENKVWNAFFKSFLPELVQKKIVRAEGEESWRSDNEQWPTRDLNVDTAHQFALLLGGQLPTPRQWDITAGYYDKMGRSGPTVYGSAAFKRENPRAINDQTSDVGPNGIRDLAGNGWEFTREARRNGKAVMLPIDKPDPLDKVVLRSRDWELADALTYEKLGLQINDPQLEKYADGSDHISFRIVIELPD